MANQQAPQTANTNPSTTRMDGQPDHRFKENRGAAPTQPAMSAVQPSQQQAPIAQNGIAGNESGGVVNGMHVTKDGKPDERYKENRALSESEVNQKWAENMATQNGAPDPSASSAKR